MTSRLFSKAAYAAAGAAATVAAVGIMSQVYADNAANGVGKKLMYDIPSLSLSEPDKDKFELKQVRCGKAYNQT